LFSSFLKTLHSFDEAVEFFKNPLFGAVEEPLFRGCSKMFRCKARKKPNREAYIIYVERCVLQRNPGLRRDKLRR
jgi:hypothetical protein